MIGSIPGAGFLLFHVYNIAEARLHCIVSVSMKAPSNNAFAANSSGSFNESQHPM